MKKGEFLGLLRNLMELVDSMEEEHFRALQKGQLTFLTVKEKEGLLALAEGKKPVKKAVKQEEPVDFAPLIRELSRMEDAQEAMQYLKTHPLVKTNQRLQELIRYLGCSLPRDKTKEGLQRFIINRLVVMRLQSESLDRVTRG